ncbi:MAG TPA: CinA family protein [Gammaproteobacteria bacterium]|jgi:nicotinamide-nucleotide amidase|nr:CinA family protein [Gammaproteobacteria bacterium]
MDKEIEKLAHEVGMMFKQKNMKLATAESCTGGGLGFWITSIPGSSEWYDRGFITYTNAAKTEMLNVKPHTLDMYGAVSEPVVIEMADGALAQSDADITIAVSGIAGPDGGSPDKPVGTVWIAYASKNSRSEAFIELFPGDREAVRLATIKRALEQVIKFTL